MLHQDLELRKSRLQGRGVFAKTRIPKGTILLISDPESIVCRTKEQYKKLSKKRKAFFNRWAYPEDDDRLCYYKDIARYINHSCDPNMATANDFDIAIRDIEAGDEITCDYGTIEPAWLNLKPMKCSCKSKNCRKLIGLLPKKSKAYKRLQRLTSSASKYMSKVRQPVLKMYKQKTHRKI